MAEVNQDFEMFRGDDATLVISVKNADGSPKNLTGSTAIRWAMSRSPSDDVALISKTLGSGVSYIDQIGGVFQVQIAAADTEDLSPRSYYHEAEVTDASNRKSTVLIGTVAIKPSL
jgi:hypothetical protein